MQSIDSHRPLILVVDDAPDSIEPIVNCLHNADFRTRIATSGSRALQLVRLEVDPASQLIPEISGNRVLLAIRLSRADAEGRLRPMNDSVQLPLTLCA